MNTRCWVPKGLGAVANALSIPPGEYVNEERSHLLVDYRPQFYISDMIKIMKGNLARQMFLLHPELKKELWGGHLWNSSYCAVTVSDRSREQVLAYIEGQKEKSR